MTPPGTWNICVVVTLEKKSLFLLRTGALPYRNHLVFRVESSQSLFIISGQEEETLQFKFKARNTCDIRLAGAEDHQTLAKHTAGGISTTLATKIQITP
jgi:hypothetical protein